uniref:DUF148 domain-containing protein n=1 Tax=Parastrongyloides trichosuri TaxID=131310 RepID=A0A0N5A2H6_PARTI
MKVFIFAIISIGTLVSSLADDEMPQFVNEMSKEGRNKFEALMTEENKTKVQINNDILDIISNESDNVKKAFEEANSKKNEHEKELKQKLQEMKNNLSPEAQNVISKIDGIVSDMNITKKQEMEQITEAINSITDDNTKLELEELRKKIYKRDVGCEDVQEELGSWNK